MSWCVIYVQERQCRQLIRKITKENTAADRSFLTGQAGEPLGHLIPTFRRI